MKLVSADQNKTVNFSNMKISPISLPYYMNLQSSTTELDFDLGRTNRWFDLTQASLDPHFYALKKAIDEGMSGKNFVKHVSKMLEINRKFSIAKNAAQQFGLIETKSKLNKYPFWAEVLPWDIYSIDEVVIKTPFEVKKNRSLHNLIIESNNPLEIMKIDHQYSIYSHAEQYKKLFFSIKKKGFIQSDSLGYIHVDLLVKNGDYRWKPGKDGNHRIVLLAAMGVKKILCIIDKVIRYEDIDFWPNVVNKTFTKVEAEKIFNRIFHACPPNFYSKWINYCKNFNE